MADTQEIAAKEMNGLVLGTKTKEVSSESFPTQKEKYHLETSEIRTASRFKHHQAHSGN